MKIKKTLLFSIIIFSLFSSLFSVNSLGITPDINYTFDQDILFDDTIDSYNTSTPSAREPYNLRYQQEYTEVYNATYSFTNEFGLNDSDISFVDISSGLGNTEVLINNSVDGHSEVLELRDNDIINTFGIINNFLLSKNIIIELWIRSTDFTKRTTLILRNDSIPIINLRFDSSRIDSFNGSEFITIKSGLLNNIWYHLKIETNDDLNIFDFFFNDINEGTFDYQTDSTIGFNSIVFASRTSDSGYSTYLDAIGYSFNDITYTGIDFDISTESTNGKGITWKDNSFWIVDTTDREVYNYDSSGIYTGIHFDTSGQSLNPYGIVWNGTSFWIVETTGNVYNYNSNGIYTGLTFPTIALTPEGITWNGTHFWIIDTVFTDVYTYDKTGSVIDIIDISSEITTPNGITYDNNSIWITGATNERVYNYDNLGGYTGISFDVSSVSNNPHGIVWNDTSFWILDNTNNEVYNFDHKYSFEYYVGLNILPIINKSSTLQEVNRYEFSLNDIHTFNAIGSSNFNGWNETELPSGDKVVIAEEPDASYDRVIEVEVNQFENRGITKNFTITDKIVNVSIGFYSTIMDGNTGSDRIGINMFSQDGAKPNVLDIKIYDNLNVAYYNGTDFVFTNWHIDLGSHNRYEFNFLFHYEINRVYFEMRKNGISLDIYDIYLLTPNHFGLSKITFSTTMGSANTLNYFIDYVGIYARGISQVEKGIDFGIALIDINNVWNRENHNLFNFIGNGTFHIASTSLYYFYGRETIPIKETTTYYNENQFLNVYYSVIHLFSGIVVLTVLGNNFNFSYLKINGVILNDTYNSYNLIFEHSGVNIQESFFYTDSNNKLQFTHISNDTDTEYIQARFNINDSTSTDARIHFRSLINNNAKGFFRINYTTTSDFIPFPTVQSTTSIFLTQGKNIRDFLIVISDLDDNTITGLTSGFIDNIKLLYLGNVQLTVITLSLVGMLVPLIIILTPTVALRDLYGESFVIPIFLLMSLILTIGLIIPVWLFFIIAISSSLFLIKENIKQDD